MDMDTRLREILLEQGVDPASPVVALSWAEVLPQVAAALVRRGYTPQSVDARLALVAVGALVDGRIAHAQMEEKK